MTHHDRSMYFWSWALCLLVIVSLGCSKRTPHGADDLLSDEKLIEMAKEIAKKKGLPVEEYDQFAVDVSGGYWEVSLMRVTEEIGFGGNGVTVVFEYPSGRYVRIRISQ